jgi:hypothetical protein
MINPVRRKQIHRALLEALSMAGGYALEESMLFNYVDDLVKPPLSFAEKGCTTAFLKDQQWIRQVEDTMDPGMKQWVITELGRNQLASL